MVDKYRNGHSANRIAHRVSFNAFNALGECFMIHLRLHGFALAQADMFGLQAFGGPLGSSLIEPAA
ncbi:MAG: hypothetical protein Q8R02_17705 [Hyphomonadaceae bacterium]|nr:hypothetical protein [Hyphomonadaceae bacterium]